MAAPLVEGLHTEFDPADYEDALPRGGPEAVEARRRARTSAARARGDSPPTTCSPARGEPERLMPRSLWTGSLSFGLVNVPVAMFSGVSDKDLHFRQLHAKDHTPVETHRFCAEEDEEVPTTRSPTATRPTTRSW